MSTPKRVVCLAALLAIVAGIAFVLWWKHGEPRRESLRALQNLCDALTVNEPGAILDLIILPDPLKIRTSHEQFEFVQKALRDEISPHGIRVLCRNGTFGPLSEMFPEHAQQWATQAGVRVEQCVAFRANRAGITAEAVLFKLDGSPGGRHYRVIRCNNIKQLSEEG